MKFYLYAMDEVVGWSDLPSVDPPMGVACGSFHPNDSYKKIQAVIRERHFHDGSLGPMNEEQLRHEREKIKVLRLQVKTETSDVVDAAGGVSLTDYSHELNEDPYFLEVMGLSQETIQKYWQASSIIESLSDRIEPT